MLQENKIILRSVFKITRCILEPAKNPATGRYPDCVRRVNAQGDMILSEKDLNSGKIFIKEDETIELYDGLTFNLDDEHDAAYWEAYRYTKKIAQDRWERDKDGNLVIDGDARKYGTAEFYIERPGFESKQRNDNKRAIHEAKSYIYSDSSEALYQKVRLLGHPMFGLPQSEVEEYLISVAEKQPALIADLYTGGNTNLRLFLLDALDKFVIRFKDKLYCYGDAIVLGASEQAVLSYFKNPANKRIVEGIKRETYPDMFPDEVEEPADITVSATATVKATKK